MAKRTASTSAYAVPSKRSRPDTPALPKEPVPKINLFSQPNIPFQKWINSYPMVSSWMAQYDLPRLIDSSGGLVRIPNFLPLHIAEGILQVLAQLPDSTWKQTAATEDYSHNNISHEFWSTKQGRGLDAVTRLFGLLLPDSFSTFSAARYNRQHHIAPHDDRAYTQVRVEDSGQLLTCSRDVAVIYYLTKDWKREDGGHLIDLEAAGQGPKADQACTAGRGSTTAGQGAGCGGPDGAGPGVYVPRFNSMVAFRVPRYHQVTAVAGGRPRYSIFGWFLVPGKKYELYLGEDSAGPQHQQQPSHARQKHQLEDVEASSVAAGHEHPHVQHAPNGVRRQADPLQTQVSLEIRTDAGVEKLPGSFGDYACWQAIAEAVASAPVLLPRYMQGRRKHGWHVVNTRLWHGQSLSNETQ